MGSVGSRGGGGQAPAALALLLLSPFALACQHKRALAYTISLSEGSPEHLAVTLDIENSPRGDLVLEGFAPRQTLRVDQLEAAGPGGEAVQVATDYETVGVGSRTVDVPRFVLRGPLPASMRIRYRVKPGSREGDSHLGYTGRCHGHADGRFAYLSGRNLFLVPQPVKSTGRIEVRFSLPEGWNAVVPWRAEKDGWLTGLDGELLVEDLIAAPVGLGKFREREFEIERTHYRLAFEAGIPADQQEHAAGLMERVARYLHDLFGRDLEPSYLVVSVPRAPTGDEIAGEAWATGQGGTLAPLTAGRLQGFAENLIEAYLLHARKRTEIRRPEEFWLVDGVKNLYSWKAVVSAGLVSEEDISRELVIRYMETLSMHGLERDLEKLYSAPEVPRAARSALAPFVLAHLERELSNASKGAASLEALVGRLFRGRRAESLWSLLPAVRPGLWEDFRARFVRGTALAPLEDFYALAPTRPSPEPPAGRAVSQVTLAYSGETVGYLENCGCKGNQAGGVARRATLIERLRKRDPGALVLDAGDAFPEPKSAADLDFLSRQEHDLYLRSLDRMGYDAVAVGTTELMFGPDSFREHTRGLSTPYLAANVRAAGRPIALGSIRLRSGGVTVAVVGVIEPPRGPSASRLFEEQALSIQAEDPVETLRREVPALSRQANLVIAMGRLSPRTIRRVVEACPELDVIISSDFKAPARPGGRPRAELHPEDQEGFLGRTLVLYTHYTSYGLSSVRLGVDREGRVTSAALEDHPLDEKVPDHPQVREMLNQFYDRIGSLDAAQKSVAPLFADDPLRSNGRYVGAAVCAPCHEAEHAQWLTTGHAGAYKTLLDRHRHFQPKCVSCHVVGYGTPSGYKLGAAEETLANVQCEVCHGPGARHAEDSSPRTIQRKVSEEVCLECHDQEHSDHFVYAERLPRVMHSQPGGSRM